MVAEALEGCGLRYLVGGSLASSLSGEPRSTLDVDLVVSISEKDVQPFVGGSVLDEQQMNRRQRVQVASDPDRHLYFYTPEDILLQKLNWYRAGNEVSDRQWRDIQGIVLVQSGLDEAYLRDGAQRPGVIDLLDRAMIEGRDS